jgi:hypothetical protein
MERDYVSINTDTWNKDRAKWVEFAQERSVFEAPDWGCWENAAENLNLVPSDMTGTKARAWVRNWFWVLRSAARR